MTLWMRLRLWWRNVRKASVALADGMERPGEPPVTRANIADKAREAYLREKRRSP